MPSVTTTPLTVRWVTSLDDLVDGVRVTTSGTLRIIGAIGVAVIGWGAYTIASGDLPFGMFLVIYGVVDLALVSTRRLQRALIRLRMAHVAGRPCEVSITMDGLAYSQWGATGVLAWPALTGVRQDARTLLLVSGRTPRFGIR